MSGRILAALFVVVAVASLLPAAAAGQDTSSFRTPWGDPDLQGIWTNATTTGLERPDDLTDQAFLTAEERTARDEERVRTSDRPPPPGQTGAYNSFWLERGLQNERTSLIVDPDNGKLPPLMPAESARRAAYNDALDLDPTGPEDRSLYERCISRGMPGSMMPGFYNHNYQILQTPGYVAILVEMIHDVRIIPLDERPHADGQIRQWLGDSRGRWEGNTLVVETTNLAPVAGRTRTVFGASATTHLVERFTRIDEHTVDYEFTLTDPTEYHSAWTASIPMTDLGGPIYEYACHEGNYGLENILAGARAEEKMAAMATKSE